MKQTVVASSKKKRRKKAAPVKALPVKENAAAAPRAKTPPAQPSGGLEKALRAWRLEEARKRNVPAFRIFSDQALRAMAESRPATAAELLAIPGIGISTVEKYGRQLYRLLKP